MGPALSYFTLNYALSTEKGIYQSTGYESSQTNTKVFEVIRN